MKFKGFLALVGALVLVGIAQPASAGVHLEPYVGYGAGSWEKGSSGEDFKGLLYGGRLGYTMLGLAGGVEYMGGSLKDDGVTVRTIKPADLGLWVGFTFPILIRAYATYFFQAKSNITGSGIDDDYKGTGMKLGLGFTTLPFLSVNLEYLTETWDEDGNGALSPEASATAYMVSLSIPLDI